MSLMNKREATGLSIVELSNRIASLYNTKLSPELIERIESKQTKLKMKTHKYWLNFLIQPLKI